MTGYPCSERFALTELNEQHAIAHSLIRRQYHDTGQVVVVVRDLLFREEADYMVTSSIRIGQYVEQDCMEDISILVS